MNHCAILIAALRIRSAMQQWRDDRFRVARVRSQRAEPLRRTVLQILHACLLAVVFFPSKCFPSLRAISLPSDWVNDSNQVSSINDGVSIVISDNFGSYVQDMFVCNDDRARINFKLLYNLWVYSEPLIYINCGISCVDKCSVHTIPNSFRLSTHNVHVSFRHLYWKTRSRECWACI